MRHSCRQVRVGSNGIFLALSVSACCKKQNTSLQNTVVNTLVYSMLVKSINGKKEQSTNWTTYTEFSDGGEEPGAVRSEVSILFTQPKLHREEVTL